MKVKYKLCPSKPQLRNMYNKLLVEKEINPNHSFLNHTLKISVVQHRVLVL